MFYDALKESNPDFVEEYGIELITWYERYDQVDRVHMVPTGERRLSESARTLRLRFSRNHSHNFILRHNSIHPYEADRNNVVCLESRTLRLPDRGSLRQRLSSHDPNRLQVRSTTHQSLLRAGVGNVDAYTLGDFRKMHKERLHQVSPLHRHPLRTRRGSDYAYPEWMSNSYDGVIVTVRNRSYVMTSAKLAMIENLVYQHGNLDVIQRIDPNYRREYAALHCPAQRCGSRDPLPAVDRVRKSLPTLLQEALDHDLASLRRSFLAPRTTHCTSSRTPCTTTCCTIFATRTALRCWIHMTETRSRRSQLILNPNHAARSCLGITPSAECSCRTGRPSRPSSQVLSSVQLIRHTRARSALRTKKYILGVV